jgi:hypothetical protein
MRRLGIMWVLVLALTAAAAACGDDDGATTTETYSTGATTTTAATTTTTAATTTSAATTTTTAAPTTTTTTLPADAHPTFGLSWGEMFPPEGATATYRVTTYAGETLELPATIEYGVEWRGGTWDRVVIGTPEPGNDAMVVYFDRSAPWGFAVKGDEVFTAATTGGPDMVEFFEEPFTFDALGLPDTPFVGATDITLEFAGGGGMTLGVTYRVEVVALGEDVEVAAGTLGPTVQLQATVGGELLGGTTFSLDMWLHPDQFLVKMTEGPAFSIIELLTPWA